MSKTKTIGNFELKEGTLTASCEELQIREEYPVVLIHEKEKRFMDNDCILSFHTLDDFQKEDDIKSAVGEELYEAVKHCFDINKCSEAARKLAKQDTKYLFDYHFDKKAENKGLGQRGFFSIYYYTIKKGYETIGDLLNEPPSKVMSGERVGPKRFESFIRFLKENGLEPTDCGEWGKLVAELRD